MSSEWRKLLKQLHQAGWTLEYKGRGGHLRAMPPGRKTVVMIPGTPSDQRSYFNTRAKLRRLGFEG